MNSHSHGHPDPADDQFVVVDDHAAFHAAHGPYDFATALRIAKPMPGAVVVKLTPAPELESTSHDA